MPVWRAAPAVFFALLLTLGPLGLLQVVAWTGMVFDYSLRYGVASGLERTFDGKNPCGLCEAIGEARAQNAERHDVQLTPTKLQGLEPELARVPAAATAWQPPAHERENRRYAARAEQPDAPPPRTLAA